jgi:hypothetical protein
MDPQTKIEVEAAAFRRLKHHLMELRPDVQNIDLMNLSGFYGMPFVQWKAEYQTEANPTAQETFVKNHK